MKNIFFIGLGLIMVIGITSFSFISNDSAQENDVAGAIQWISFEEAMEKVSVEGNTKKVFVDVYTDWCGWCKVMDKKTFNHPEVAKYMSENFYMVKFDAESKKDIEFKGTTFKFVPSGRNGYHELAAALLQGQLSYPSVLFMDEKMDLITVVPGYQPPENFYPIAKYFGDNNYLEQKWDDFRKSYKNPF